jgi:Xaa-Pro aminopeptidase
MTDIQIEEFQNRIEKTRNIMQQRELDTLFIYADHYRCANTSYYVNYRTMDCVRNAPAAILLPLNGKPVIFMSWMNMEAAKSYKSLWIKNIEDIWNLENNIPKVISNQGLRVNRIGIVGEDILPVSIYRSLQTSLPHAEFLYSSDIPQSLMVVKSESEISLMKEACQLADLGMKNALEALAPGRTEFYVAAAAEYEVVKSGGIIEEDTLVRSGKRTQPPGPEGPTTKELSVGEFVVVDFHPSAKAYMADLARTVILGNGTEKKKAALKFAHHLREFTIDAIRPGLNSSEVFERVYKEAEKSEYFENWREGIGNQRTIVHGLGMGEEEWNNINKNSDFMIKPNMTFSVRVNLYNIDSEAVYFEDPIFITSKGSELLTSAETPLIV